MVKIERTPTPPASLAIEKEKESTGKKVNGDYGKNDVVFQLEADFHGKCYLCEQKGLNDIHVEHLQPHHGGRNIDLKFSWNNLFYCCSHCNSVKTQKKYNSNILDCCVIDPETMVHQGFADGHVKVVPLVTNLEAETTADLIQDCFELRNHARRELQSRAKCKALFTTMNVLYKRLDEYAAGNKNLLPALRGMLSREYKFAGFTRTYVRDHLDKYPDLAQYVN